MPLRTLFRTLVVLSPVLVAIAIAYHHFAEPQLSDDWRTIVARSGDGGWPSHAGARFASASDTVWLVLLVSLILAAFAVQVGLFFFRAWARAIYVVLTLAFLVTVPFSGLSISLPLEAALYEAVSIADGLIIALAYFSPLRREFTKSRIA